MTRDATASLARLAALGAAAVLPPLAYHALIVAQGASPLVLAVGWASTAAAVLVLARLAGARAAGLALAAAAVATVWLIARGTRFGVYVAPIATWVILLLAFARTLGPGRVPLVTRLARLCHDEPLSPDIDRYTRAVTVAWSVFFAAVAASLGAAAALLPLPAWSLLANVAAWPLVAVMFAAEYAVRRRRFPGLAHVTPLAMVTRVARAGWTSASGAR